MPISWPWGYIREGFKENLPMKSQISYLSLAGKVLSTMGILIALLIFIKEDYIRVKEQLTWEFMTNNLKIDQEKIKAKARLITLNQLIPHFDHLLLSLEDPSLADPQEFRKYVIYYRKVTEYFPQLADAHGILGFCYFQLGEKEKAIVSLKKARELNPNFFWHSFNLGVVLWKGKRYPEAIEILKKASTLPPALTIKLLYSSKVYQQILEGGKISQEEIEQNLKEGYRVCFSLVVEGSKVLKGFGTAAESHNLNLRIF